MTVSLLEYLFYVNVLSFKQNILFYFFLQKCLHEAVSFPYNCGSTGKIKFVYLIKLKHDQNRHLVIRIYRDRFAENRE